MKKITILYTLLLFFINLKAQDIKWVYEFKGANAKSISRSFYLPTIFDSKGNTFVQLYINDTLLINNQTIVNDKKGCIVLVALDSNGIFRWIYTIKAGDQLRVKDMIATSDGSVVIIGNYNSTLLLPGGQKLDSLAYTNGFMIKINPAGNMVWSKSHKYAHYDAKLAADTNGNIYVNLSTGTLGGMVNDTALQKKKGTSIAKFDKNGSLLKLNSNINGSIGNIAVSASGNHVYIFNILEQKSNIQYDTFNIIDSTLKQGEKDFYVACANAELDFVFLEKFQAKTKYGLDYLFYKSMCVDKDENFYFSFVFQGKLDIAGNNYYSVSPFPIWIKIDTTGAIKWAFTTKDSTGFVTSSFNMGTTKDSNIYACTALSGNCRVGPLNVNRTMFINMFFDDSANIYAAREFWGSGYPRLNGTVTGDGENTYVLQVYDSVWYKQKYYGNGADRMVYVKLANPYYSIGVNNLQQSKNISLYPNPNNGIATIEHTANKKEMLTIYNMLGETVYQNNWLPSQTQQMIDINKLPSGLYIMRLGDCEMKFVKQ